MEYLLQRNYYLHNYVSFHESIRAISSANICHYSKFFDKRLSIFKCVTYKMLSLVAKRGISCYKQVETIKAYFLEIRMS